MDRRRVAIKPSVASAPQNAPGSRHQATGWAFSEFQSGTERVPAHLQDTARHGGGDGPVNPSWVFVVVHFRTVGTRRTLHNGAVRHK